MTTYEELARSRREWIDGVLLPWCRKASRRELLKAESDWINLAGRVDPETTLWCWAWGRFAALVHPELHRIDEAQEIVVRLQDGREVRGFPNAQRSLRGELHVVCGSGQEQGPFPIDEIGAVERV